MISSIESEEWEIKLLWSGLLKAMTGRKNCAANFDRYKYTFEKKSTNTAAKF